MLCCAQLCQRVLSQPAANPHSRSVTPNEPTFAQRTFWAIFFVTTSSPYSLMHILPTSSSKSAPNRPTFLTCSSAKRALATVLGTFRQQLLQMEARNRKNRDPTSATTEATLPEKTQDFVPKSVVKPEVTRSRPVTLPKYLMMMMRMMRLMMMWLTG